MNPASVAGTDQQEDTMSAPTTDTAAIRQIIRALRDADYVLDYVDDGGEEIKVSTEQEAIDAITAVDSAHLFVTHPTNSPSHVWFVLGNDPEEVAADHGVSLEDAIGPLMRSWW
jgi:hypothetical protein